MMINLGISEEEVLNFFEDINLQTKKEIPDAPKNDEKLEDLLGQPWVNLITRCFTLNHLHMTFLLSQ